MISPFGSKSLRLMGPAIAIVFLLGLASEVDARGRGGGGRGGMSRGGMSRGGVSRGGPARGGSIRRERSGGGYRSYESGHRSGANRRNRDFPGDAGGWDRSGSRDSIERKGSFENRRRDHLDREGSIRSSTGIDAESKGKIRKTDDGFVARGVIVGEDGAAAGTIVRRGDQTYVRGVATDGDKITRGRAHCNGSHCYGGRVTADINRYYRHPYYYYPYYYGWYSCPYGGINTWHSRYGTPIYGCANVVVISTTIVLGSSDPDYVPSTDGNWFAGSSDSTSGGDGITANKPKWPREAKVSSKPVLMYEISDEVVSYATGDAPVDVYSEKHGDYYYWVPGPAKASKETKAWSAAAGKMKQPTANSTVITYVVGERTVYLTNERPVPGFFSEAANQLFVWIPGVKEPSDEERAVIDKVIAAHRAGGKDALDREARKLQKGREAPPKVAQGGAEKPGEPGA